MTERVTAEEFLAAKEANPQFVITRGRWCEYGINNDGDMTCSVCGLTLVVIHRGKLNADDVYGRACTGIETEIDACFGEDYAQGFADGFDGCCDYCNTENQSEDYVNGCNDGAECWLAQKGPEVSLDWPPAHDHS